jgi:transposase
MARPAPLIDLTSEQRALLEGLARSRETAHSLVQRAQIVLQAADGEHNKQIAQALGLNEDSVGQWRRRWVNAHDTLAARAGQPKYLRATIEEVLSDRPRSGSPGDFSAEQICQIIALACETPPDPLTHWTRDDLVRETIARGIAETISASTIGRFLKSGRPQAPSHPVLAQSQDRGRGHLPGGGAHGLRSLPSGRGVA